MLSPHSPAAKRAFLTSRGGALVGVIGVHMAALAFAMFAHFKVDPEVVPEVPISVSMLTESTPEAAPVIKPKLEEIVPIVPVMPISIELPHEPAPAAITVVAKADPAPPSPPVAPAAGDAPIMVSNADYMRMPAPVYPRAAKAARAQGMVMVRVLIETDGHPRDVQVHRSSGFVALDRAACDAVMAATFKPYLINGVARTVMVIVPINFSLSERQHRGPPPSQFDVRREDHDAMRRHPEELGGLGTASLHEREQPELQPGQE